MLPRLQICLILQFVMSSIIHCSNCALVLNIPFFMFVNFVQNKLVYKTTGIQFLQSTDFVMSYISWLIRKFLFF